MTMTRISVNDWRLLEAEKQEEYQYISDATGCYFIKKEKMDEPEEVVDDFERLTKRKEVD